MAGFLLVLFFVVGPLVELAVAIQVGRWIGALPTIGLLIALSVAGVLVVRHEGIGLWRSVRRQLRDGQVPGVEALDHLMVLVAGLLLVLPGFVTAVVGLALLLPPVRVGVRALLARALGRRVALVTRGVRVVTVRQPAQRVGDVTPPGWQAQHGDGNPPALGGR